MRFKTIILILALVIGCPTLSIAKNPDDSMMSGRTIAEGKHAMSLGGGFALAIPFLLFETGYGMGPNTDVSIGYESVLGLFHFFHGGARYSIIKGNTWNGAIRLRINYNLFGLKTDQLNLTSTVYLTPEIIFSQRITPDTSLIYSVNSELDVLEYLVENGVPESNYVFRYDATTFRFGMLTTFNPTTNFFTVVRIRIPIETFVYETKAFAVIPFLVVGTTWSW